MVLATGIGHRHITWVSGFDFDHLDMKKQYARWGPRLLKIDHKRNRVTTSIECLALLNRNKDEFLRRERNMDTAQHARDQAAVQTGQSGFVSQ